MRVGPSQRSPIGYREYREKEGHQILSLATMTTEEQREEEVSIVFALFSGILATVIILSKKLHDLPALHSVFSEASLVLVVGLIAGFFVHMFAVRHMVVPNYYGTDDEEEEGEAYHVASTLLSFSPSLFFMALLPPIMFNSGYQLRRELFYRHIKPIVLFSCVGTTVSALAVAFILYSCLGLGLLGDFQPALIELLTFGSLIAATDTVSVLGVFQAKKVDPHLFYLCFGESALNDAVALVLFKTFTSFMQNNESSAMTVVRRCIYFFMDISVEAIGSPLMGMGFGFTTALIFKHIDFRKHPHLELPLYLVLSIYAPFILAECFELSGIVTIFFCGISARRYVEPNVSKETAVSSEQFFQLAAYLAETCIFLELGLSIFGLKGSFQWRFIILAFLAALAGRAISIYPIALYHNWSIQEEHVISPNENSKERPFAVVDGLENVTSFVSETMSMDQSDTTAAALAAKREKKQRKRKTPLKRKDQKITWNMMHVLWFAGLRGAVAYACVRDFPDVYGHNDEFIATTVAIVLIMIIFMGGATGHLLKYLGVEMNVDEERYMQDWHQQRSLKGMFHTFGESV